MSRSKAIKPRAIEPDVKYSSTLVTKLINRVMKSGKKTVAAAQVYQALDLVAHDTNQDAIEALETAIKNITPQMEVRSRRVGGAAYQVPTPVRGPRASALAIRWLVLESSKRPSGEFHSFGQKLAAEIKDALENSGGAIQKKLTSHKMAEANKAFAHFRW